MPYSQLYIELITANFLGWISDELTFMFLLGSMAMAIIVEVKLSIIYPQIKEFRKNKLKEKARQEKSNGD